MRVLVGRCRGRKLVAPPGRDTRPILDRVKVALFDRLSARWGPPGPLPPIDVLDLFAGGGSLGIEALSRGAAFCCFVERSRPALRCLRTNLDTLDLAARALIVPADALSAAIPTPPSGTYDLVFLDPPYRLSRRPAPLEPLFIRLGREIPVAADAQVVWRHERCNPPPAPPSNWRVARRSDHGSMSLAYLTPV